MSESVLHIEIKNQIAILTMNRPNAMNAISSELRDALADTFYDLKDNPSVRVAILTGAGRAFCAGLDLKELADENGMAVTFSGENNVKMDIAAPLKEFGKPIIAAINGAAITGGFELALACDILIATTEARFADTHARVGVIPGAGLSQKLSRLIGIYRAKELSLTGNFIDADQALEWGLVNRVLAPEELMPACISLAKDIISCPEDMIRRYKQLIDDGFDTSFGNGLKLERKTHFEQFHTFKPEAFAKRREDIIKRGRDQNSEK